MNPHLPAGRLVIVTLAGLFAFLAATPPALARTPAGQRYAVLVGKSRRFSDKRHGVPPT